MPELVAKFSEAQMSEREVVFGLIFSFHFADRKFVVKDFEE